MPRPANGESVKVNAEVSKHVDQVIRDYQIAKTKRFDKKVSKNDASSELIELAVPLAKKQIETWNTEIEDLETKIQNLKNQM